MSAMTMSLQNPPDRSAYVEDNFKENGPISEVKKPLVRRAIITTFHFVSVAHELLFAYDRLCYIFV